MLEEFLCNIGLHRAGHPLDFSLMLEPLSEWVDAQDVTESDRSYLASHLAAFICEYLIATKEAHRLIVGSRVMLRVPIQEGIMREFDPYAVAFDMATNRGNLKAFLDTMSS